MKFFFLLLSCFSLFFSNSRAATPLLKDLVAEQIRGIMIDLNTGFLPTTVTPASSLGKYFGLEVGLGFGASDSPHLNQISTSLGGEAVTKMPHGFGMGILHLPFGVGIEYTAMPFKTGDIKYDYQSIGLKWTFTDVISVIPIDIRLRSQYTDAYLEYTQNILNIPIQVKYLAQSLSYNITASKKIFFLEPFIGYGYHRVVSDLRYQGNISIFDSNVSFEQREGVVFSDNYLFWGLQLNIFALRLGLEFTEIFGNDRFTAKLSFAF